MPSGGKLFKGISRTFQIFRKEGGLGKGRFPFDGLHNTIRGKGGCFPGEVRGAGFPFWKVYITLSKGKEGTEFPGKR